MVVVVVSLNRNLKTKIEHGNNFFKIVSFFLWNKKKYLILKI